MCHDGCRCRLDLDFTQVPLRAEHADWDMLLVHGEGRHYAVSRQDEAGDITKNKVIITFVFKAIGTFYGLTKNVQTAITF